MILLSSSFDLRLWRNWQTHQTQNLAVVISCGFESHQPHWRNLEKSRFLFLCCKAENVWNRSLLTLYGFICPVNFCLNGSMSQDFFIGILWKIPMQWMEKNKFSGDIVIQQKGSSRLFFIKNTHAFACVSFLVFRFFHDPAFSCTFIAIFPAQGTAIAADGTSVLISHITQCHTKDDKQKLSHTIPPLIWVVSSGVFIIIPENAKIRKSIMQNGYGKRQ